MIDWSAVQGMGSLITLAVCALGQLYLSAKRAGTVHQKLREIERKVTAFDTMVAPAATQRADHERRLSELEAEIEPLKVSKDQFLELRGQSRAEHIAQNKTMEDLKTQIRDLGTSLSSRLDTLQRQLTNLVQGSANELEEVARYPRGRRRGNGG